MNELVTRLHREVITYFAATDLTQIEHTETVHNFAQLIARLEKLDEHTRCLIEMSALLHDIGCPNAPNQEKEGKPLAEQMLSGYPMPEADKALIAEVVGAHHHLNTLKTLGFEILAEADLIVNLLEGYYKKEQAQHLYDHFVTTESGKELYRNMFLKKP
jgi:HD superfamily phosphodiesterase